MVFETADSNYTQPNQMHYTSRLSTIHFDTFVPGHFKRHYLLSGLYTLLVAVGQVQTMFARVARLQQTLFHKHKIVDDSKQR